MSQLVGILSQEQMQGRMRCFAHGNHGLSRLDRVPWLVAIELIFVCRLGFAYVLVIG